MDTEKKYVVVPWDFTESSEYSLAHAIQLARVMDNGIVLLKIISTKKGLFSSNKRISAEEETALREKMETKAKEIKETTKLDTIAVVKLGDSKKLVINEIKSVNANLVVLPYRYALVGNKYKDSVFNSIVSESNIPFVVTSKPPRHDYYKELVVPVDHDKKYKESLAWIIYLSRYYNCNVNMIKPFITDSFMKKDMANNIYFTKKMLDKHGIIYGIKTAKKKQPFKTETFRFTELIDADIIVMMLKQYNKWISKDEKLNTSSPIMVVPPRSDIIKYGALA
ncbi:MAG TPA: universal stress protein [Salinivirgaceae bacterium]|nr:universal stress protein [Salinivirgaceae bacterium]HQA76265.1 universal stress protein [Salinivirgaceae bacterium]